MEKHRETPAKEPPARAPYSSPRLGQFGTAATLTAAVSMSGMMDGFMGLRTG